MNKLANCEAHCVSAASCLCCVIPLCLPIEYTVIAMAEQKHFKSVVHTINFWVACLLTTLSQDLAPHRTSFILLRNSSPAIQVTSFLGPSVNAYRATLERIQETLLML